MTQSAFVLHSQAYREHQRLITFFTEHQGKITALCYPGRTAKSNKSALLQPFLPLVTDFSGSQGLLSLKQIEAIGKNIALAQQHLYAAFYLNELLVRTLPEHIACDSLFALYRATLTQLAEQQAIEPLLRCFELTLLDELGYSLDFSPCYQQPEQQFTWHVEQGFIVVNSRVQPTFSGLALQLIAERDFTELATRRAAKQLMRVVLAPLLGSKPLHSRKLFT